MEWFVRLYKYHRNFEAKTSTTNLLGCGLQVSNRVTWPETAAGWHLHLWTNYYFCSLPYHKKLWPKESERDPKLLARTRSSCVSKWVRCLDIFCHIFPFRADFSPIIGHSKWLTAKKNGICLFFNPLLTQFSVKKGAWWQFL